MTTRVPSAEEKVGDETVITKYSKVVKKLFEEDGDVDSVDKYAKEVGMDEANARILKIGKTEGKAAMFKAMTTHDDGTPMTYAESRARYG